MTSLMALIVALVTAGIGGAPVYTAPPAPDPDTVTIAGEAVPAALDLMTWTRLADCESGGDWHLPSYPYRGGLQWWPATWRTVGGTGDPAAAPIAEQIDRARTLVTLAGWGQWPACAKHLGLVGK